MPLSRLLILGGALLLALGVIVYLCEWSGIGIGRLPGDLRIERPGFSFYFPVTTCLILSVLGTLVFWLVNKFK